MVLGEGLIGAEVISTIVPAGEVVRYLEVFLSVYGSVLLKEWWACQIALWGKALLDWGGRHISLAGRVIVLNIFWMPKLWYLVYYLDFPAWVVRRLLVMAKNW